MFQYYVSYILKKHLATDLSCRVLLPAVESIVGTDVRCLNGFGTALETIEQLIRVRNDPVNFAENHQGIQGNYEYLWISMNIYEYLWISMNIYEYLWISMNIYEYLWISMNHQQHFQWVNTQSEIISCCQWKGCCATAKCLPTTVRSVSVWQFGPSILMVFELHPWFCLCLCLSKLVWMGDPKSQLRAVAIRQDSFLRVWSGIPRIRRCLIVSVNCILLALIDLDSCRFFVTNAEE